MYRELYIEYYIAEMQVRIATEEVKSVIDEKTRLYQKTQPSSPIMDSERVDGGKSVNQIEEYVESMEQKKIEEKLARAESILNDRITVLDSLRKQLMQSKEPENQVFYYKYLMYLKPYQIAIKINYSDSQTYRILKRIKQKLRMVGRDYKL